MSDIDALFQRWLSGDERAAEVIYTQNRGATFGLAYALLDNVADAEEVTQAVLDFQQAASEPKTVKWYDAYHQLKLRPGPLLGKRFDASNTHSYSAASFDSTQAHST